ncbi:hypothetical protein A3H87_04185 [Candidatus Curtissbacteria bacterium RIFCSPLOWO2_02_FULL_42_37]|uniref:Response regulatory domain-containing protein n=1 Tax=Candidatus Curtissbacteria bacterium RIFCSPLOWO2_01_FULL_42_50 TaxID=1797730 RepID=A0A1F5H7G2_9BACT|nr:MAG: hypothetical protein A3C33_02600 [Candidatus Curtissbacteria bacterium RIFCSPHIGHO2_02_FULL_42_58]OGE00019.1 MAG: hypothetical protein A3B54_05175 [Candidatus Curtissbacteria bacterium RIFCSPLOWO2_01_FULL_42_50]OGE03316.1 MAG: hypothetical protein A3G16_00680 [Candidatus Curtissbacteria bacterium RIFCSPLOWO2_12_FULL_41_16]OGE11860.1 MAG: hypothetical protein A3H87_04185 [Candidatus Curtissbacteria bacterium RIFCSPLOWO2_02_FULL_42_37]
MKRILLVEDDLLAARASQRRLEEAGYEVECALDGEEALHKVHNGCYLVVLDLLLPKVDGWEVLEKLKNHDGTKHIPVVVCTVLDGEDYRQRAQKFGADAYINKFNDDLVAEVNRILGGGIEEIFTD